MATYKEIVLAAWLHDIGKFAQRAGEQCPKDVVYTEFFLQKVKDCLPDDVRAAEVIRLASAHHNPSAYDEWIIAHGDRLSSGSDRCNILLEQKNCDDEIPAKFYEKPLIHLISSLRLKEKPTSVNGYSPLKPMEGNAIFASVNAKVSKQEYQELWQKFKQDFEELKGLQYKDFIRSLDTLMERYCWCIPSSTIQDTDISLYQHSKTTAAFAGTLYLYHKEHNTETESALGIRDEKAFLFIQGDISGIQNYIFDLKTTSNNAKLLRARSFQVWALSEIIAEYLTGEFGVSRENIISSAGGKFLLLVPNVPQAAKKLPALRLEIEKFFLREFAGKITFVLSDGIPASGSDVQKGNMQKLLNLIGKKGEEAKQRKMQAVLREYGPELSELYDRLQERGECEYCETLPADKTRDGKKICTNCDKLIDIGGRLMKTDKIILKTDTLSRFDEMVKLLKHDDPQFGYLTEYQAGFPLMSLPYAAPVKDNNLCTFEEIADKAEGSNKLAMFKADIDNLGLVFTSSWGAGKDNRISFSRYAQLSRQLHYFFSAYVSGFIIKNHSEYQEKIYTVFSGGDDLCILGAWDAVMRFAADFRNKFDAFTNNNPSVTLSGGIALADPRLPVRFIAAEAEEALEEAKGRKDKNSISVFGVTVCWKKYGQSLKDGETIFEYMNSNKVSSAVVYKMIDFANRAQAVKAGKLRDLLWMSNYRYIITRNIEAQYKETLDFFNQFGVSPEAMEQSRIAVSYALYKNRKGKENV
jgi:CRISPR-associated protein Csm1